MSYEPEEMNEEEREEAEPATKKNQPGTGTVFVFQIIVACLLIAAAVVLKTSFPNAYEDVKIRYYDLLNREVGLGALEESLSGLLGRENNETPNDSASSHVPSALEAEPSSQGETSVEGEGDPVISAEQTDDEVTE